jgi:hypothetical protein
MQTQEPASKWPGLVRRTAASLAAAASLAGCSMQPLQPITGPYVAAGDLEFLDKALNASPGGREAMLRDVQASDRTQNNQLRLALMQSVPEYSGYDPAAAQHGLRALLAQNPSEDIAAVARVRLSEIKANSQCVGETQELRRRLAQVVDIERQIDNRGRQQ